MPCRKQIVGSTQDPTKRWRNYKSTCNSESSNSTGLASHFMDGCPFDTGKEKSTLDITLIDYYDTTQENLQKAKHMPGPYCQCKECTNLKHLEDRWILKMGTFYGTSGLNSRDDAKSKAISHKKWTDFKGVGDRGVWFYPPVPFPLIGGAVTSTATW